MYRSKEITNCIFRLKLFLCVLSVADLSFVLKGVQTRGVNVENVTCVHFPKSGSIVCRFHLKTPDKVTWMDEDNHLCEP